MAKNLVIVESPAKVKSISKFLGDDFIVEASVGHVLDLPKRNPKGVKAPVPGIDLENDFKPTYVTIEGKKKHLAKLKKAARQAASGGPHRGLERLAPMATTNTTMSASFAALRAARFISLPRRSLAR